MRSASFRHEILIPIIIDVFAVTFSFWFPTVFLFAVAGPSIGRVGSVLLNVTIPALTFVGLIATYSRRSGRNPFLHCYLALLFVWMSEPFVMFFFASVTGSRFFHGDILARLFSLVKMTLFFPGAMLIFSLYGGTLPALVVVTLGLLVAPFFLRMETRVFHGKKTF
ncbi:MAG: hypothetical protein D6679_05785 [Candidatus Hydrogenedentota bacterium]|nr:MAG: hypothetical protein D6679_05785 [Candidatus Hydrogenedentota bacterium]